MAKYIRAAALILWMVATLTSRAQSDLPILTLNAPITSLAEPPDFSSTDDAAFFIFTSNQTNGLTFTVEFSGDVSISDFSAVLQTNLSIPAGTNTTTLSVRARRDTLLEGTEYLNVKILPDPSYQIGSPSTASLAILDRTLFTSNTTNIFFSLRDNTNLVLAATLPFEVAVFGYETLLVRMLVDNALVAETFLPARVASNTIVMSWTNAVAGAHTIQFISYNESGGTSRTGPITIYIAAHVLSPIRTATSGRTSTNVYAYRSGPTDWLGLVEFAIPSDATNLNASFKFQTGLEGGSPYPLRDRIEVFAYAAGPTNLQEVIALPREFVALIETNLNPAVEIDLTPWVRKFAGSKLGIIFAPDQLTYQSSSIARFSKFSLILNAPEIMDAGPHARFLTSFPNIVPTNTITIQAEIQDPDSAISRVYLLDGKNVVAVDAPTIPYSAGTNIVTFNITLPKGLHALSVRASSLGKTATTRQLLVYVGQGGDPTTGVAPHRWLGSQNTSAAFYVVDAAGRAQVWGRNDRGQLGLGFTNSTREYGIKHPVTLRAPNGLRFRQITSAQRYAAAITDDGLLYVWGTNKLTPTPVPLPAGVFALKGIAALAQQLIVVDESNKMWFGDETGWRPGMNGLVVKATQDSYAYMRTDGLVAWSSPFGTATFDVKDFAVGDAFYGIDTNGMLFRSLYFPVTLTADGATSWQRVVASPGYTLAIDQDGRMFAWDRGFYVFRDSNVGVQVPFPPGVTNFIDFTATSIIAMAVTDKGEVYAWGHAAPGFWADPAASTAYVPELVHGLPDLLDPNAANGAATFTSTLLTSTGLTIKLASSAATPITIEASNDLYTWTTYTNLTSAAGTTTLTLPVENTTTKYFRLAP
jgi:hypothetical protein